MKYTADELYKKYNKEELIKLANDNGITAVEKMSKKEIASKLESVIFPDLDFEAPEPAVHVEETSKSSTDLFKEEMSKRNDTQKSEISFNDVLRQRMGEDKFTEALSKRGKSASFNDELKKRLSK